ncbi:MAG: PAS domain S-box protein [Chitinophagaceae bacterium]|nr:PAS domain S-box protein [Chitinophagaceae bacterium]
MTDHTNTYRGLFKKVLNWLTVRPFIPALIAFLVVGGLGAIIVRYEYYKRLNSDKAVYRLILEQAQKRIQQTLNQGLSTAQALLFLIDEDGNVSPDFDSSAAKLKRYNEYVDALEIVPDGVIKYIYPLEGNESVVGYDILEDSLRNKEAFKAIGKNKIFYAGPISLRQGGYGIVGRIPVLRKGKFWGFTSIVIRLETLEKAIGVKSGRVKDYYFQLSKNNPDTRIDELFLNNGRKPSKNAQKVFIPEGEWTLSVSDKRKYPYLIGLLPLIGLASTITLVFVWLVWSITKRPARLESLVKSKTAELEKNSKRSNLIVSAIPDLLFILDQKGFYKDYSNPSGKPFIKEPSEIIGKHLTDILPPDISDEIQAGIKKVIDTGYSLVHNYSMNENGIKNYYEATMSLIGENEVMSIVRNVTDRVTAEIALRNSEEKLKQVLMSSADDFYVIDKNFRITMINQWAVDNLSKAWGKPVQTGVNILDVVPADRREKIAENFKKVFDGEKIEYEVEGFNEGNRYWVLVNYMPVFDNEGQTTSAIVITRDITERKRAEAELIDSEKRNRALVENAPEALVVFDVESGKFVSVSESAVQLFGLSKEELLKIGPADVSPEFQPDGRLSSEASLEMVDRAIRGEKLSFEWMHCDVHKVPIACEVRLVRLPSDKSILIRGGIIDIGERKKAERKLQESEEKYRTFFENSLDGIMLTAPDGKILSANPAACNMFDMTEEEIIKAGRKELVDATDGSLSVLLEARRLYGKASGELTMIRKSGIKFPVEVTSAVFIDAFGNERTSMIIRDITERRKAEEEVLRTNARFTMLSKATSDIVWDWDLVTGELWWSNNYYVTLGYKKKKEFVEIDEWYDRIHPEDLKKVKRDIEEAFSGNLNVWRETYRYRHDQGHYLHFLDRGFIIRDKNGKAIRMIGAMVDMTEINEARLKLAESENRLRAILDSNPDCIKLIDINGNLEEINKGGLVMLGLDDPERILGKKLYGLLGEPYRKRADNLIKKAFEGEISVLEYELFDFRGNTLWCISHIVPYRNAAGEIISALVVTADHTDRMKAETELRKSEEKYRTLLEQAGDGIILSDLDGRIIEANESICQITGYAREQLLEIKIPDLFFEKDIKANPLKYKELINTGRLLSERTIRQKDGTEQIVEISNKVIFGNTIFSIVRNVTERKKTERKIEETSHQLRMLSAYLQQIREDERKYMAREIHDELGQQLTVLKMDVAWLNKRLATEDKKVQQKLNELLDMLDHTVKTVRRISSELRPSLLDDLGLIAAIEWQLSEFEKRSEIHTLLIGPEEEPDLSQTIKTEIFRILQESLTNVGRHSGADEVKVIISIKDGIFNMEITDNGKGFDVNKLRQKKTLGILGMRERATMIGGTYNLLTRQKQGVSVFVSVPLH